MKIYYWERSEAMKDYYDGQIIVLASSLEEAKEKVRQKLQHRFGGYKERNPDSHFGLYLSDSQEDREQKIQKILEILEKDLEKEPITGQDVIFIKGYG